MESWFRSEKIWNNRKELASATVGTSTLSKAVSTNKKESTQQKYIDIAFRKRQERDEKIQQELKMLPEFPQELVNLVLDSTATDLANLLNDDKLTSEQLLNIYHRRAITIGLDLELIAESNYENALQLARNCDEIRKKTPKEDRKKLGLLFGVPFSVKDTFFQKGLDATCGLAARCFKPAPEDGWIITFLKQQGMIPYIRSNIPQLLVITESPNIIWGRAKNPWNKERTPGGSSGGEGGLIASRCSPIGFGADGFGSLRIPASYSGVYAFKGTQTRFSQIGQRSLNTFSVSRKALVQDNYGPMAKCVEDLGTFMKVLISEEHRKADPVVPYVPWDASKEKLTKKLKIGYCLSDDLFPTAAPVKRAVLEAVEAMRKLGHECHEIVVPRMKEMILATLAISNADGKSRGKMEALEGEQPLPELSLSIRMTTIPYIVRRLFADAIATAGFSRWSALMKNMRELKTYEYFTVISELFKYKKEFYDFWLNNKFDSLILPGDGLPAIKHGLANSLALSGCYMYLGNVLNLPSGVVPITKVRPGEDTYKTSGTKEKDLFYKKACKSMEGSVGMPVSVCVYTLPWEDEKCIGVMKQLESQINFHELPKL